MVNKNLNLVENEKKFYEFIRILRTHKENIFGFLERLNISEEQQEKYMSKYSNQYMICLSGETPVGFVGSIDNDVRFAVEPSLKNKGIGTFMIKEYSKFHKGLNAKVLLDNIPSQKVFEKCNYKLTGVDEIFKYYKNDN
jgi:RimJ/RimL family protein N-acetyltransferase